MTWLANREELGLPEDRRHERIVPRNPRAVLGLEDGTEHVVRLIDISLSGTAEISNDRSKIAELWSKFDKAWWDDETDPDIRLITVRPERAELWDSPGKLIAFTAMLTAAVTGAKPDFGDNATVRI